LAARALDEVDGLARRQHHQHLPQVVAVVQAREAALRGGAAEAGEGAQRNVLFVGHAARRRGGSNGRISAQSSTGSNGFAIALSSVCIEMGIRCPHV
jgi:hypothetical protein